MIADVIAALSEQLQHGVDVHRCASANALGRIQLPDSANVLCEALRDEDPDVRTDAAVALGQLAIPATADNLMENLIGDPCGEVKISAIDSLVKMRHIPVIPWLRRLVAGRDEEIAWDDDEFYAGTWDDWLDVQMAAIRGLGDLGADEGVAEIRSALLDEMGQDVSEYAVAALAKLGSDGATALADLFNSGDARMRRRIADVVCASSEPALSALQNSCLVDETVEVRCAAAAGLAAVNPGDDRLAVMFADLDAGLREVLAKTCGAEFPDQTRSLLEDKIPSVKCAAFRIVAQNPDLFEREGFDEIIRAHATGHPVVSGEAAVAWAALNGSDALAALKTSFCDVEQSVEFRRLLIGALAQLGPPAVDVLASAAGDDNRQIRIDVLTALADIAAKQDNWPDAAGEALLAALHGELVLPPDEVEEDDADEEVQETADEVDENEEQAVACSPAENSSTLDEILSSNDKAGDQSESDEPPKAELPDEIVEKLELAKRRKIGKKVISLDVVVAPHQDVRRFAARLLSDIADQDVALHLIASLDEDDAELHQASVESLARIGETLGQLPEAAAMPLEELIESKVPELRRSTIRALAWIPGIETSERLRSLLGDVDIHARLEAVRGLEARGEIDGDFEQMLHDSFPGIRLAAAKALARSRGSSAFDALFDLAFADDGMHRREIARLLGSIAPDAAMRRFLDVLADQDRRREWLVAIEALGELAGCCNDPESRAAA